jgi:hypothetical protein
MHYKSTQLLVLSFLFICLLSCQKDLKTTSSTEPMLAQKAASVTGTQGCIALPSNFTAPVTGPYTISLVQQNEVVSSGRSWTWKVTRNSGTQSISHWDLFLPPCLPDSDVVSISYSYNNVNFTSLQVNHQADPSLNNCPSLANYCVVKFDVGHQDANATIYYRMVVKKSMTAGKGFSIYKSGSQTGCGAMTMDGIGCEEPVKAGCVWSQGYWFANPKKDRWGGKSLTIGNKTYTEAEAKDIWATSNAGGLQVCKAAFTQGGAVKLSLQADPSISLPQNVKDALAAIEKYLSIIPKLKPVLVKQGRSWVPGMVCGTGAGLTQAQIDAAAAAAGFIGTWISRQPCHQGESQSIPQ